MNTVPKEAVETLAVWCFNRESDKPGRWVTAGPTPKESARAQARDLLGRIAPAIRKQERERVREALEETIDAVADEYEMAIGLIRELLSDAERIYEPGHEDPPHIASARDLTEHVGALRELRAALDTPAVGESR